MCPGCAVSQGPFNVVNNAQSTVLLSAMAARAQQDGTTLMYSAGVWPTDGPDDTAIDRGHFPGQLQATYYTSADLTGPAVLNRTEPMIASTFFFYGFDPQYPSNTFSGRWTGTVVWPATVPNGRLVIRTGDSGHVRVSLDGKVVIDGWSGQGTCQPCALPYSFVQGQSHALVVEYGQTGQQQQLIVGWDLVGDNNAASIQRAVQVASQADAVIIAVGDNSHTCGEGVDRISLTLPGLQEQLVHAVAAAGKPTVVVLFSGRAPAIPLIARSPNVTAILEAYDPGQAQGVALVDVLYGDFNPGGRLPLTYPTDVGQVPLFYNHKGTGWANNYEDLSPSSPVYPFGSGLSYSTFAYSDLSISPVNVTATGYVNVSFTLKNTSPTPGTETPQLYLTDRVSSTTMPDKMLRGFSRIHVDAGESVRVVMTLNVSADCRLVDANLQWTVEAGEFDVSISTDSSDPAVKLSGQFHVVASGNEQGAGGVTEDVEMRKRRVREANEKEEADRVARLAAKVSVSAAPQLSAIDTASS